MFNPIAYKAFNPDLVNLNNNKLLVHWKTIGKKENRISCFEDFFNLYPNFNIDKHKKNHFKDSNPDTIQILVHKHLNNINQPQLQQPNNINIIPNIYNIDPTINNNIDPTINNNIDPTINNNIDPTINNNIDPTINNNTDYIENILNNYYLVNNLDYTIIFINNNKNIITKFIQYIFSILNYQNSIVMIISNIDLSFYEKMYSNLKIYFIKNLYNDNINKVIKNIKTKWIIFFNNFQNFNLNFINLIENDIKIINIKFIYYSLINNSTILGFNNNFFKKFLYYDINLINQIHLLKNHIYLERNIITIKNKKVFNNLLYNLNINNSINYLNNKNIIIDIEIYNYESILFFFNIFSFCLKHNYNLYTINNKIQILDIYNYTHNINELFEIYSLNDIINNNKNLLIKKINIKDDIKNNIQNINLLNNYKIPINLNYLKSFYKSLNFLDVKKEIITIYIDKNIYNEKYYNFIINSITRINFQKNYLIIICQDEEFIKNIELFNDISYIYYKNLNNININDDNLIIYILLLSNYILINDCDLLHIINYINSNSKIFIPYTYKTFNNHNLYYINQESINNNLNNKILYICFQKYILKNNKLYSIKNINKLNYDILYLNFYILKLINNNTEFELTNISNKINYIYNNNYQDYAINLNKNNDKYYKKIFNNYELLDNDNLNNYLKISNINVYINNNINENIIDTKKSINFNYYILYISNNFNYDNIYIKLLINKLFFIKNKKFIYFTKNNNSIENNYKNLDYFNIIVNNDNNINNKLNIFYNLIDDKSIIFYIKNLYFYNINNIIIDDNLILNNKFINNDFIICNKTYFKDLYKLNDNIIDNFLYLNYKIINNYIFNENIFNIKLFIYLYEKNKIFVKKKINNYKVTEKDLIINYNVNNKINNIFNIQLYEIINIDHSKNNVNHFINNILIKNKDFTNKNIYFILNYIDYNIDKDFIINNNNLIIYSDNISIIKIKINNLKNSGYLDSEIINESKDVFNFLIYKNKTNINYFNKDLNKSDYFHLKFNFENDYNKLLFNKFKNIFSNYKTFLNYYLNLRYNLTYNIFNNISINIINLKERYDKLNHIENNLKLLDIYKYNIFNAYKPENNDLKKYNFIKSEKFLNKFNINYVLGSAGCKLSHYYLLKKYLNSELPYLMILEDDALLELNFKTFISLALQNINDFDILYLSVNLDNKKDAKIINPFILKIYSGKTTTGYIVKTKNIQKILNVIENSEAEIDNAYSDSNLIKYCINPMILFQTNLKSDINDEVLDYGFYHEKFFYKL